jgi:hypothetical protein
VLSYSGCLICFRELTASILSNASKVNQPLSTSLSQPASLNQPLSKREESEELKDYCKFLQKTKVLLSSYFQSSRADERAKRIIRFQVKLAWKAHINAPIVDSTVMYR